MSEQQDSLSSDRRTSSSSESNSKEEDTKDDTDNKSDDTSKDMARKSNSLTSVNASCDFDFTKSDHFIFEIQGESRYEFYSWYSSNFSDEPLYIFLGKRKPSTIHLLAVAIPNQSTFHASLMTADGTYHGTFSTDNLPPAHCLSFRSFGERLRDYSLKRLEYSIQCHMPLLCINDNFMTEALLTYHRKMRGTKTVKAGILFQGENDDTEKAMYLNAGNNISYQSFLDFVGRRILLRNWEKYSGGLDTHDDLSGKESIYTCYQGYQIMFHVSTMIDLRETFDYLPRKRHIGNDVLIIIFRENDINFDPNVIRSRQTHIVILVTPANNNNAYKIETILRQPVPDFEPCCITIEKNYEGQAKFWSLVAGAHNIARCAPAFMDREKKTRARLLQAVVDRSPAFVRSEEEKNEDI